MDELSGRELDKEIAERVFGMDRTLARVDPMNRNGEPQYHWGYPHGHDFAPEYSAGISSAWQVVDAMRNQDFVFQINSGIDGGIVVEFWDPIDHGHDEDEECEEAVWAETAPLAICRAALKALGGK